MVHDSESNFQTNPLPALKASDRSGRVIYVSSLSKALSPGLRLGFMVADPDLIDEARALRRLVTPPSIHKPTFSIKWRIFWLRGIETHLRRYRDDSAHRWEMLNNALSSLLPECQPLPGSEHANAFWLRTPAHIAQQLTWRAAHTGVLIEPGARHFLDAAPPDNFSAWAFTLSTPTPLRRGSMCCATNWRRWVSPPGGTPTRAAAGTARTAMG